jgi:hypothetical protein
LQAQYERAQADRASANADLERARLEEYEASVHAACDRIAANDYWLRSINDAAVNLQRQQQPQQIDAPFAASDLKPHQIQLAQKYNLSAAEMSAALSATGDNRVDDATREQDYARGKQLMLERRAAGYRDEADYQGKR